MLEGRLKNVVGNYVSEMESGEFYSNWILIEIYLIAHLPRSRILSRILTRLISLFGPTISSTASVSPGLKVIAKITPKKELKNDVNAKYPKVLVVILLPKELLMVEVATIKLDIISGNMSIFKRRINSSPGYERTRSKSGGIFICRRIVPETN